MAEEQSQAESTQVAYQSRSQGRSMGTLIPRNMEAAAQFALDRFENQHGSIDEYVRAHLVYGSTEELLGRLYAEQVDTVGLAISNLERGDGFVIGDQTGIGKGCQCASIMLYAKRQGKPVVFLTKGPDLYKDMMRDLTTIGVNDFKPFATNSNLKITLENGNSLRAGKKAEQDQEMKRLMALGSLDQYDAVFTSYAQVQTVKGKEPLRRDFLRAVAEQGAIIICDESHEAGGSLSSDWDTNKPPDRADFIRKLIDTAIESGGGVVYSSATYAKRPDVMDLYARSTDLRFAVEKGSLENTLRSGGVPLQQVIASKFVCSGQMMRRERSFEGVEFITKTVSANHETADRISGAMRAIRDFDREKKQAIKDLSKQLKAEATAVTADGAIGDVGVRSTNFTSLMHNCIEQGLLAQKAEATVQASLEALREGRKPVIALSNTMGSFIEFWADENSAKPGDTVDITFSDLLERYLTRSRDLSTRDYKGEYERRQLTNEELGPDGAAAYAKALFIIRESDFSQIPISPIDYIRGRLEDEGYKTVEVTGRSATLDYAPDGTATYQTRSGKERTTAGKIQAVNAFNNGEADVIVLNKSGSTGISLHASEKFADQRPREMLVAQADRDINVFMQMLGRVHRTGQVELPSYTLLTTDLPAEKRPAAILSDKMATLNANVTADRETATTIQGVVDFFNEYGEEVIEQLLDDYPELNAKLDNPLSSAGKGDLVLVRKMTGRIPLLPVAEQGEVYSLIEGEYRDYVEQKEAMGESLLQAGQLDLDARTIARMEVVADSGDMQSEFSGPVYLEIIDAKSQSKPLSQLQVANLTSQFLNLEPVGKLAEVDWTSISDAGRKQSREQLKQLEEFTQQYRSGKVAQLEARRAVAKKGLKEGKVSPVDERIVKLNEKLDRQLEQVAKTLNEFPAGTTVRIIRAGNEKTADMFYGVVTGIEHKDRPGSPSTPSSWHLKLALANGEVKSLNVPTSAVNSESGRSGSLRIDKVETDIWSGKPIYELFDAQQGDIRQERQMLTGNIVRAWDKFSAGKITNFTDHRGRIRQGVLLPKSFDMGHRLKNEPVVFKEPGQVREFIEDTTKGIGSVKTMDSILTIRKKEGGYVLETPRAKASGGKYYLDKDLIDRVGGDFLSSGESMRVTVPPERMENTLTYLMSRDKLACYDPNFLPAAREQMGIQLPKMERAPEGGVLEVDDFVIDGNVVPYVEGPTPGIRHKLEALLNQSEPPPEQPPAEVVEDEPIADKPSDKTEPELAQSTAEPQAVSSQEVDPPQPEPGAVSSIKPSEEYPPLSKASVEKNIAKFLHAAGLADQVMQGEEFHLRINNEPYIPLVVEAHDMGGENRQLFLTHYREQNGDLILDAEMVFNLTREGFLGLDQTAVEDPFRGGEYREYNGGDRSFARIFSKNILAQGFAEAAKQMAQAEPSQPESQLPSGTALDDLASKVVDELVAIAVPIDSFDAQQQTQHTTILAYRQLPSLQGLSRDDQDQLLYHLWQHGVPGQSVEISTLQETKTLSTDELAQAIPQDIGGPLFDIYLSPEFTLEQSPEQAVQAESGSPSLSGDRPTGQSAELRPLVEQFLNDSGLTTLLQNCNEPIDLNVENGDKAPLTISIDTTVSPTEISFATALEVPNCKRMGAFMEYLVGEDELSLTMTSWGGIWDSGGGDPRLAAEFIQTLFDQGFADAIKNQLTTEYGLDVPEGKHIQLEQQVIGITQPHQPAPQPAPTSEQDKLLGTLRSWYRHARAIGRSAKHLDRIAEIGKAVVAGQMDAYGPRAMEVSQKDEAAWKAMVDRFIVQAVQILNREGQPDGPGAKIVEGKNFTLKTDDDSLSISHSERGQILLIEDNQLKTASVNNVDVERFALKLEHQPQTVAASVEYEQ